ncbi:tRNA (adenosine(37)-N6)-threonylcarbamoyltransferase complex dimerization subunit type 1 TsaB [Avibacterium sp. 20-15]|uniref:tRNA (adenosine(37)-N6)-threonylcarbamoyltransferase complex dimerization subunit type 1 TsaB n=1 Tax=unclassified Avibacterium TaxID=2685287 RepID=UPI002026CB70|nr:MULTISPECIES: tRNA (adenosine(37)-N6)-threonylcarbamoyltransferase complex dimerization subunit type 1 TsaB [unclassified Avibacterium]MCW9733869.1 tRNA (adenosine(37)-N6)-threonylcarbamoyltransferase complex dimerization subunit type 1 TsaB [Avibacterium sp. 20-15]URL03972.1 tRNA (adenosine(37)-N6)-threonylcarbamoyltransferase complex dimerization subunit type 1 TsaB [Avibacterium sp. 20-132]
MTTLLALDTSTEACSVALWHKGEITHLDELAQRTHTKRILPMVDEILNQSGITLNQVDALVFGRGPGSFTGVRVGAGIAQGLALGADLPVIPISNLTTMAQQAYEQYGTTQVLCAIDARMNEVYFSQLNAEQVRLDSHQFLQWNEVVAEQVCSAQQVLALAQQGQGEWRKVGTGWRAYEALSQLDWATASDILLPSAKAMLPLALPYYWQKQWISAVEIEPVYLRNEVTWKKLPGRE